MAANGVKLSYTAYLIKAAAEAKGSPDSPNELVDHDCLTSVLLGNTWVFENGPGTATVEVRSKLHVNDTRVLTDATRKGIGLAILPRFLAREDLQSGRLVEVMKNHPVPTFWMKAQVPRIKMNKPAVSQLVEYLKGRMQPAPPSSKPTEPTAARAMPDQGRDDLRFIARSLSAGARA